MPKDYIESIKEIETRENPQKTKAKFLSPAKISSVQGVDESQSFSDTLPNLKIKASGFTDRTIQELKDQGLDNPQIVLADNSGNKAEQLTQTVLKNEGLPDGSGGIVKFKEVVKGQFDNSNHGIDLIGITEDGRPFPIEVKKRQNPSQDNMGDDKAQELLPMSEELRQDLLRERKINPALLARYEQLPHGTPDPELSTRQMGGMWTRDRWLQLAKEPIHRKRLHHAGLDEKYLNQENLENASSDEWREILDNRTTVIVSGEKNRATDRLTQQAALQRGTDIFILDLEQ